MDDNQDVPDVCILKVPPVVNGICRSFELE